MSAVLRGHFTQEVARCEERCGGELCSPCLAGPWGLKKTQQNEVLTTLLNYGFDPADFEWSEFDSDLHVDLRVPVLIHKPSEDYWFKFDMNIQGGHLAVFSPAQDKIRTVQNPGTWVYQMGYVRQWLVQLKAEVEAPDLWSQVSANPQITNDLTATPTQNARFTAEQLKLLDKRLEAIEKSLVETKELEEGHRVFVHERLDYLHTAARRQGRQDWFHTAVGVFFSIAIAIALPAEEARVFIQFALNQIADFVRALPALPRSR